MMEGFLHRWSGWPGAWCLDCGIADPHEEALANDALDYFCSICGQAWPQDPCVTGTAHRVYEVMDPRYAVTECEHPGENLFNPYSFEPEVSPT